MPQELLIVIKKRAKGKAFLKYGVFCGHKRMGNIKASQTYHAYYWWSFILKFYENSCFDYML